MHWLFFEPHRRHCVVSLSKNIYHSLVLVQPRKTRPFIAERLLMGRKESNQTKTNTGSHGKTHENPECAEMRHTCDMVTSFLLLQ